MSSETKNQDKSEQKDENTLRVLLGKETAEVQFPKNKLNPDPSKKYKLHSLTLLDLAELEDYTGVPIIEWNTTGNKVLKKLKTMLYVIHMCLAKDPEYKFSLQETSSFFGIADAGQMAQIVGGILDLSGLVPKEEGAGDQEKT